MVKNIFKSLLKSIPIAFTQNQRYDRDTKKIIRQICKTNSNCIDVGCHKGEVLDIIIETSPNGHHWGFEPIPDLFEKLKQKYPQKNITISPIALSNATGTTKFNYVISNPSYSGLKKRSYDRPSEVDTEIEVSMDLLDNLIDPKAKIDLIKIDVEGAEMLVLEGASKLITRDKPCIIFEHGLGASEFYDGSPEKTYAFFQSHGMQIYLLQDWLKANDALTLESFKNHYFNRTHYYFLAK
jgi:FkbM family methyltransferase